jgi:hypothetical protein
MGRDMGMGDWLFDFAQEAELARSAPAVITEKGRLARLFQCCCGLI